jgi:hypothetical protein
VNGFTVHRQLPQLAGNTAPLSELFQRLEVMRVKLNLLDQSISQTTLEQASAWMMLGCSLTRLGLPWVRKGPEQR